MCGICGTAGLPDGDVLVRRMAQAMVHRGPDGEGFLDREEVHLGMRRLKIIDLSTGDQPIYNEDGTVGVIFNGEIYNYRDLQVELKSLGHRFTTRSDTEVIVHAYEEWECDCPSHLRGMFALAILDCRQAEQAAGAGWRLFLARDRLGIKPLYYFLDGERLLFASEVRALLASGRVPKKLSPAGLYTYLAFGSLQDPLTLVEGVRSVPAASWLLFEKDAGELALHTENYWKPAAGELRNTSIDEVFGWLSDAVSCHLESEVPLGAFLSGGLDSGSIVALGSKALVQPMRTFSLAFDNWKGDERAAANLSAERWQSVHHVRVIIQQEVVNEISQVILDMDQPTVDGVNSWYVCREARRSGLTVALSGVGGDELFAGYPSFTLVPRLKRLPHPFPWLKALPAWKQGWSILPGTQDSRRKLAAYLSGDTALDHPYFAVRGLLSDFQTADLLNSTIKNELWERPSYLDEWKTAAAEQMRIASLYDAVGETSWLELSQYMKTTLLRDMDMMSMAHSLEVRVPLVDHRLVEGLLRIAGKEKLSPGQVKPLLVKAMGGLLPSAITERPKQTFTFPFEAWLREGLAVQVRQRLLNQHGSLSTWSDPIAVKRVWQDFEGNRTTWSRPWALYILDEWIERYL